MSKTDKRDHWLRRRVVYLIYIIKTLRAEIAQDRVSTVAAGATYFLVFAAVPFLLFTLTLAPFVIPDTVIEEWITQIELILPAELAQILTTEVTRILTIERTSVLATSFLAALWIAGSGVNALMEALNAAYNVKETRGFIHRKAIALSAALVSTVSLFVAGIAFIIGDTIFAFLVTYEVINFLLPEALIQLFRITVSIVIGIWLWSFLYWYLPNTWVRFRLFTWGSSLALLIWILASSAFAVYVNQFGRFEVTYGSLGTVVILLWWLYITNLAIILGAEINVVLDKMRQHKPLPAGKSLVRVALGEGLPRADKRPGDAKADATPSGAPQPGDPWKQLSISAQAQRTRFGLVRALMVDITTLFGDHLQWMRMEVVKDAKALALGSIGLIISASLLFVGAVFTITALAVALGGWVGAWGYVLVASLCALLAFLLLKTKQARSG